MGEKYTTNSTDTKCIFNTTYNINSLFPSVHGIMGIHTTLFFISVTANAVPICTKGGYGLEPHVRPANRWPFQIHLCYSNCLLSFLLNSNWIYDNYESCFHGFDVFTSKKNFLFWLCSVSGSSLWLAVLWEINNNASICPCINNVSNFNQFLNKQ